MNIKHDIQWESDFQRAVVVGTLLGDSSLSKSSKTANAHLACYHSEKQIKWLEQKHQWLGNMARPILHCAYTDKRDGKTRSGARFHTISTPILTELHSLFYPNGKKFLSQEVVALCTEPVTLAVLIGDDGSWDGGGVQIATKQFSFEENENMIHRLNDVFSLHSVTRTNTYKGKVYHHIRIPIQDIVTVRLLCLPYLPTFLHYKVGGETYISHRVSKVTYTCEKCGTQFEDYPNTKRQFCSRTCQSGTNWQNKGRHIESPCEQCGVVFTSQLWQKARFCSQPCWLTWKRSHKA